MREGDESVRTGGRLALLLSRSRYGISRGGLDGSGGEISPKAGSAFVIHFGVLEIATVRNSAAAAATAAAAAAQRVLPTGPPPPPNSATVGVFSKKALLKPAVGVNVLELKFLSQRLRPDRVTEILRRGWGGATKQVRPRRTTPTVSFLPLKGT